MFTMNVTYLLLFQSKKTLITPYVRSHAIHEILTELLKETIYFYGHENENLFENTLNEMLNYHLKGKTGLITAIHESSNTTIFINVYKKYLTLDFKLENIEVDERLPTLWISFYIIFIALGLHLL